MIETSHVETLLAGLNPDHETTTRTTINHSTFSGQRWAAIGDPRRRDTYSGNDFAASPQAPPG